eukprot:c24730_g1_i1 orf=1128-1442(-)
MEVPCKLFHFFAKSEMACICQISNTWKARSILFEINSACLNSYTAVSQCSFLPCREISLENPTFKSSMIKIVHCFYRVFLFSLMIHIYKFVLSVFHAVGCYIVA